MTIKISNSIRQKYDRLRNGGGASALSTDVKSVLAQAWMLVRTEWNVVIPFMLLYSLFDVGITWAVVTGAFKLGLHLAGMTYLSPDNIMRFFRAPTTVLVLVLMLVILSVMQIIQISGVMHAYSMSMIGKKATLHGMIRAGIRAGRRSFMPGNWPVIPFIIILIPLTGFYSLSFTTFEASIPGFIQEFIEASNLYYSLYVAVYLSMLAVEVTFIFGMNYYALGETDFIKACGNSRRLIRGRYGFTLLCLGVAAVLIALGITSLSASISAIIMKALKYIQGTSEAEALVVLFMNVSMFVGAFAEPVVNIAVLTSLFFRYIEDRDMLGTLSPNSFRDYRLSIPQVCFLGLALVGITLASRYYPAEGVEKPEVLNRPEIVAHRGDSVHAPENTRPAFEMALLEGVDWVELDVFQTKDGVVVISHDDDLSRTAGVNVCIHDLTYEELMQLDVGSRFSARFKDLRSSTLDEILKLFKDKVRVHIEIKYNEFSSGIEEKVLKVVNDNGMHDQVIITSLSDIPLRRLKELDPTIITTYSMYVAWEHIDDIPFADYYTIEENNVTEEMVDRVHLKGGKLFAWTVNEGKDVQYLVDCGVDGILTDDPIMLKAALDTAAYTTGLSKELRYFLAKLQRY